MLVRIGVRACQWPVAGKKYFQKTCTRVRHQTLTVWETGKHAPSKAVALACTGAGLYRPDGEFLAREAARADSIRRQLAVCQAAFDAAVDLTAPPAPKGVGVFFLSDERY